MPKDTRNLTRDQLDALTELAQDFETVISNACSAYDLNGRADYQIKQVFNVYDSIKNEIEGANG